MFHDERTPVNCLEVHSKGLGQMFHDERSTTPTPSVL
jgi:hypothetical protein